MGRYLARRLLQFIPTVLGTMFLLHYLTTLAIQFTGDPVRAIFGDRQPPQSVIDAMSVRLGLDDKCLDQPGNWCIGMFGERLEGIFFHFDFGTNFSQRPVTDIIGTSLPLTAQLALIAFIFEVIVGITVGVIAGLKNESFWDYLVKVSTVLLIAIPVFVSGIVVQQFVNLKFGNWLRDQDFVPDLISEGVFAAVWQPDYPWSSMIIPGLVLGALSLATIARLTRTSLLENKRADFARTAKAKGLSSTRVTGVHTLRNSLIPVVTYLGVDLGALMAGAIVTEQIFGIPGLGNEVYSAIFTGEATVVLGIVTFFILVYLIANLIVDVLYAVLDPRIRYE